MRCTGSNDEDTRHPIERNFDAWAEISVRLASREPAAHAAYLEQFGAAQVWPRANARWAQELAIGVAAGDLTLLRRYNACLGVVDDAAESAPTTPHSPFDGGPDATLPMPALVCPDPVTPFAPSEATPLNWSVERYARLCAELQQWPDQATYFYQCAAVPAAERRQFHEAWQACFLERPELHARYQQLLSNNKEYLAEDRGRQPHHAPSSS